MTSPVPNMQAPLVEVKDQYLKIIGRGFLIPPWNSFFQQLTQKAPAVVTVTVSPFTANANGTVIFTGVAPSIILTRGVNIDVTGQRIIPISIGDTLTWTGTPTVQFLGA